MTTNIVLPSITPALDKWGAAVNAAVIAVRDTADAAVDAANTLTTDVGGLDTRVTNLETAAGGDPATFNVPTYNTLADVQAAVTAGTLGNGGGFICLDWS